jgi:hypothetical protein
MTERCSKCGSIVVVGGHFCGECGQPVPNSAAAGIPGSANPYVPSAAPITPAAPGSSGSLLPWVVTGLAVIFLVGTVLHLFTRDQSDGPAVAADAQAIAQPTAPDVSTAVTPPASATPPPPVAPVEQADVIMPPRLPPVSQSAASTAGPSFSCARATTDVELMICGSGRLSALERQMSTLYGQIRSNRQLRRQVLVDQRLFLSQMAQCQDENCIEGMLLGRIDELSRY